MSKNIFKPVGTALCGAIAGGLLVYEGMIHNGYKQEPAPAAKTTQTAKALPPAPPVAVSPVQKQIATAAAVLRTELEKTTANKQRQEQEIKDFRGELDKLVAASEGKFKYEVMSDERNAPHFSKTTPKVWAIMWKTNLKNETKNSRVSKFVWIYNTFYEDKMEVSSRIRRNASGGKDDSFIDGKFAVLVAITNAAIQQKLVNPIEGEKILASLAATKGQPNKPSTPAAKPLSQDANPQ